MILSARTEESVFRCSKSTCNWKRSATFRKHLKSSNEFWQVDLCVSTRRVFAHVLAQVQMMCLLTKILALGAGAPRSCLCFTTFASIFTQDILRRPFLGIKAFRDRLLADDGFMNKATSCSAQSRHRTSALPVPGTAGRRAAPFAHTRLRMHAL